MKDPVQFVPLGTRTQAELLLALSRIGSIRTSDLARIVNMTQDAVRGVSGSLIAAGLVVREARKGGRNKERWLSLNQGHPLYETFKTLLSDISRDARVRPMGVRALRNASREMLQPSVVPKPIRLIGSDRSLDVLRDVYRTANRHVAETALDIKLPIPRVERHLRALEKVGIIRRRLVRGQLRSSFNSYFRYAPAFAQFLEALARLELGNAAA
jgi:DNA-binding MarR family transcriptional regulator